MQIEYYWIHDAHDTPISGPFDTVDEARSARPVDGTSWAIIAYEFEYSSSELIETSDGSDIWPPERETRCRR